MEGKKRAMKFGLLGQLQVENADGSCVPVEAPRQRAVLAVLLLSSNRVVSAEALIDMVWDGAPPRGAANTVRAYVMRLRKTLGPEAAARIETCDPGYLLRIGPHELDAATFESLWRQTAAAVHAGGEEWQSAGVKSRRALRLWRGTPLIDVHSRTLRDAWVPRFEQQHLQLLEWRIEAALELGRSNAQIPEVAGLIRQHPLREPLYRLHMLALARADRTGDALAVYREARAVLIDQLGIEPGIELQRLHQRLLDGQVPATGARPPAGTTGTTTGTTGAAGTASTAGADNPVAHPSSTRWNPAG